MSKEETVELKLDHRFLEDIRATLERNPWMGYESLEEFILDATRRRLEDVREWERSKRRLGKK